MDDGIIKAMSDAIYKLEGELKTRVDYPPAKRRDLVRTITNLKEQLLRHGVSAGSASGSSTNGSNYGSYGSSSASSRSVSGVNSPFLGVVPSSASGRGAAVVARNPLVPGTSTPAVSSTPSRAEKFAPSQQPQLRYQDFYTGDSEISNIPSPTTSTGTTDSGGHTPPHQWNRADRYPSDAHTVSDSDTNDAGGAKSGYSSVGAVSASLSSPPVPASGPSVLSVPSVLPSAVPSLPPSVSSSFPPSSSSSLSSTPLPSSSSFLDVVEISDDDSPPAAQTITIDDDDDDDDIQFQKMAFKSSPQSPFQSRHYESLFTKKRASPFVEEAIDLTAEDEGRPVKIHTSGSSSSAAALVDTKPDILAHHFRDLSDEDKSAFYRNVLQPIVNNNDRLFAGRLYNVFTTKIRESSLNIRRFQMSLNGINQRVAALSNEAALNPQSSNINTQLVGLNTQKRMIEMNLQSSKEGYNDLYSNFRLVVYEGFKDLAGMINKLKVDEINNRRTLEQTFFTNYRGSQLPPPSSSAFGAGGVFGYVPVQPSGSSDNARYDNRYTTLFGRNQADEYVAGKDIEDLISNIQDDDISPEDRISTPKELSITLLEHQKIGLAWLQNMEDGRQKAGILADDMGLGKTIQIL